MIVATMHVASCKTAELRTIAAEKNVSTEEGTHAGVLPPMTVRAEVLELPDAPIRAKSSPGLQLPLI